MKTQSHPKILSDKAYDLIDRELAKYPDDQKKSAVIASLAIAQREFGYISAEIEKEIANYLDLAPISVREVARFYNMFNSKPPAKYKLVICTNLPCALRNANKSVDIFKNILGVKANEITPDGLFSVHEGECFGACADAPVVIVNNDKMHSWMNDSKIKALLENLREDGNKKGNI
tara:strand:+ start:9969 stop:10493 length:525 start_codon:yes stop_codon:yes gene_type:complete